MLNSSHFLTQGSGTTREVTVRALTLAAPVEPTEMLRYGASFAVITGVNTMVIVTALVSCAVVEVALSSVALACFSSGGEQGGDAKNNELGELHVG